MITFLQEKRGLRKLDSDSATYKSLIEALRLIDIHNVNYYCNGTTKDEVLLKFLLD
jgi:hypothetical protein